MTVKQKADLDIILPENEVVFGNNKITIRPFPFYQLPKVTKLIAVLGVGVVAAAKNFASDEEGVAISAEGLEAVAELMGNNFNDLVELISCFTDKTAEWLLDPKNELDHESALLLIAKIVERNKRFFTKTLKNAIPMETKE